MRTKYSRTSILLAASAASFACSDDGAGVAQFFPKMVVTPAQDEVLDFKQVQVGTMAELRVRVANEGEAVLELANVTAGPPFDESFTYTVDAMLIPPGSVTFIVVKFAPTTLGAKEGILYLRAKGDPAMESQVTIRGEGVTATLKIEPQIVSFGNVVVQSTKTIAVDVTNTSSITADVRFEPGTNVKLCSAAGADPSVFCLSPTKPLDAESRFRLNRGEQTTINVTLRPTVAGTRERGSFTLSACEGAACLKEVRLDGIGIEQGFRCTPPNIAFGQVNPGSCLTRTVSCENIANEQVTIIGWSQPTSGGSSSPDFRIEPYTTPVVLDEGGKVEVDVTYCPQSLGNDEGTLAIETNNPDPRRQFVSIPLSGTGGGPDIDVTPATVNYGQVSLLAPSRRTISVQNAGVSGLALGEMVTTGPFRVTSAAPAQDIGPGSFFDITVEFQPLVEGAVRGTLIIPSNDQDEAMVEVTLLGTGVNLPPCSFEVVPPTLTFGAVERARTLSRAFEIRNTGTSECLITAARIVPGSGMEFSLPDGDVMSTRIAAGSSKTIRVVYAPTTIGVHRGQVEFSISSPMSPYNTVELAGTGADAALLIVPNDLNFGTIGVGCSARQRTITIYNTGSSAALITGIDQATPANPAFTVLALPSPLPGGPYSLPPGGAMSFDIGFRAASVAQYAGAVEIDATIAGMPTTFVVSLQGAGALDARQVDEFDQLGRPKVDILFVIDDSGSMSEEQNALASNFAAFVQFALAQNLDFQIGVTTTDVESGPNGRLVPVLGTTAQKITTPLSMPSPEAHFAANANVGTNGSATEQGLRAAYLALSNPLIGTSNASFLRPDAVLSVIIISDEEDSSPGGVDFYVNFFLSIKGFRNTNLFTLSGIVGDAPNGCNGAGGSATAGLRYVQAAMRTGGVFQSICTADWSRSLETLSTTAFGFKSRFFLTNQPVPGSARVFVDDRELPAVSPQGSNNWSYDFPTNSINFEAFATPEPGAHIRVEYVAECL